MTIRHSIKVCPQCGIQFKKSRFHRLKSGEIRVQKFCSKDCFNASRRDSSIPTGSKRCSRCAAIKLSEGNFDKHRYAHDGYKSECKACRKVYNRGAYQAVKDTPKQKQANLRNTLSTKYGLTPDNYAALVKSQNGVCAICGKPPTATGRCKRLHVDHCHRSNVVRGLLCIGCNRALGSFGDTLDGVMRAVRYLERT